MADNVKETFEVNIEYQIQRDGDVLLEEMFTTQITPGELKQIDDYICESQEHATCQMVDLPEKIYERLSDCAYDDATRHFEGTPVELEENDEIVLQTYLPGEVVDALSDEAYDMLPQELFEGDGAVYESE